MSSFKPMGESVPAKVGANLFRIVTSIRNKRYDLLPPKKNPFPTISIGGISAGGTGKTPLTDLLLKELYQRGYTPVLFSRGYGRKSTKSIIVAPYEKVDWQKTGDEPAMLRRKNPFIWLAIDPNRSRALKTIRNTLPTNAVLVMDDGYQHRQFSRDIDILTLPLTILQDKLIPMGLMREPLDSAKRASVITLISSPGEEEEAERTLAELKSLFPKKQVFSLVLETKEWHSLSGARVENTVEEKITLISGIARPERFINAAKKSCKNIEKIYTYPDHHSFSPSDFQRLNEIRTPRIGTTEKDLIRLNTENFDNREKLWYLIAVVRFNSALQKLEFFEYIDKGMRQIG